MPKWFSPRYRVKLTVLRVMGSGVCPAGLEPGDSWTWEWAVPQGLCPWLAYCVFPLFQALSFGGNVPWEQNGNYTEVCCLDPRSPVVVAIERGEQMQPRS